LKKIEDKNVTFSYIKDKVKEFVDERDWGKFHSPKNLSMSIAIEAAELMEHFQWENSDKRDFPEDKMTEIKEELADILMYCFSMANSLNIDITKAVLDKLEKNKKKYPVEKAKGIAKKYDKL
jgi:NTP pyrophosphatase (non-canonical NTP hydrolase)